MEFYMIVKLLNTIIYKDNKLVTLTTEAYNQLTETKIQPIVTVQHHYSKGNKM